MQQNKNFLSPFKSDEIILLSEFLQKLSLENFQGKVDVISPKIMGHIFIEKGEPIFAQTEEIKGEEALLKLLETPSSTFTAIPSSEIPPANMSHQLEELLIEFSYRSQKITRQSTLSTTKTHQVTSKSNDFLLVHLSEKNIFEFPISKNDLSIGRDQKNILCLADKSVSSHHALIFLREGIYFIKDLNSANGTQINDVKVQESSLKIGDKIKLGEILIEFQSKLKRPELQSRSKAELKNPLQKKKGDKKIMQYDVTSALRITSGLGSDIKKGIDSESKARTKQLVFFALTGILLLGIAVYAYFLR